MTSSIPYEVYEQRAAEQRRQLHNSVVELRRTVKDKLDVRKNAREHLWPAAGAVAVLGVVLGYGLAGFFVRE